MYSIVFPQVLDMIVSFSKLSDLGYFGESAAVESIYHAQTENLQWNYYFLTAAVLIVS